MDLPEPRGSDTQMLLDRRGAGADRPPHPLLDISRSEPLWGGDAHQTYNQLLPVTATALADRVRHKEALGFHDIRVGNDPDPRLQKFIGENLPLVLPEARAAFDQYKDLLMSYGSLEIDYTEFAAR